MKIPKYSRSFARSQWRKSFGGGAAFRAFRRTNPFRVFTGRCKA